MIPPWPLGLVLQPTQAMICMHLLCAEDNGPHSQPAGMDLVVGLASWHMTHKLKQNKGASTESRTEKDVPTQGIRPAQTVEPL